MNLEVTNNVRQASESYLTAIGGVYTWDATRKEMVRQTSLREAEKLKADDFVVIISKKTGYEVNRPLLPSSIAAVLREATAAYYPRDDVFVSIQSLQVAIAPHENWLNEGIITFVGDSEKTTGTLRVDNSENATYVRIADSDGREIHRWAAARVLDPAARLEIPRRF